MRPSREGRAEGEQGIVKNDELGVRGETDIGLEGLDSAGERRAKRRDRGVRAVGPTEPVRDQKRRRDTRMGAGKTCLDVTVSSPGRDQNVTTRTLIWLLAGGQPGDDPRVAVDHRLVEHFDRGKAGVLAKPGQGLAGEAPIDEVVAGIDVARPANLDSG